MKHLFLDESGELGFQGGSSNHLLIGVIATDAPKRLKNRVRKEKKKLHDAGWPTDLEIKGTALFGCRRDPRIPKEISDDRERWLQRLIAASLPDGATVLYSIVRKSALAPHLKAAPYGIVYNWLAANLLCRAYQDHIAGPLTLFADQRSKETHDKMTFSTYIHSRLIKECQHAEACHIHYRESHDVIGLQAADFICWALFRYYEHDDHTYQAMIQPSVGYRDNWYARQ